MVSALRTWRIGLIELDDWDGSDRARLVTLCAAISGDRDAAEDLAQETIVEAWRSRERLRDSEGTDRWLAGIARNVCRRWRRRRALERRRAGGLPDGAEPADAADVEAEFERAELAVLVDRALGLLAPDARTILERRYLREEPIDEVSARLRVSPDAAVMRLNRARSALRRVLHTELADEAASHGLIDAALTGWVETRVWCGTCGRCRLLMLRGVAPELTAFRCPGCDPSAASTSSEFRLGNPLFGPLVGSLVRPASIMARAADWIVDYYGGGRRDVACTRCGRPTPLEAYVREDVPSPHRRGLYANCAACREQVTCSLGGLALALPAVRDFRRTHPRTEALPEQEVDVHGIPGFLLRFEDVAGTRAAEVLFAREGLQVLEAHVVGGRP